MIGCGARAPPTIAKTLSDLLFERSLMESGEADGPAACSSPAVFEAGNGRYTLDLDDEVEILNPSGAETADTVEVLRFRHEIEGVPRTFVIYVAENEPTEAIDQLSVIDDRYGIPDEELVKIAARAYVVHGNGPAHDNFVKRFSARIEAQCQELGAFPAVPADLASEDPELAFRVKHTQP